MEAKAIARHVRVTPRKARRMVDLIRGKKATEAVTILKFAPQAAALPVRKVLESAIANARVKADKAGEPFRENDLVVKTTYVDEGVTLKRFRARAQGRAARINKRTSTSRSSLPTRKGIAEMGQKINRSDTVWASLRAIARSGSPIPTRSASATVISCSKTTRSARS